MSTSNGGITWGCVASPTYGVGATSGLAGLNNVLRPSFRDPQWPASCVGSAPYNVYGLAVDNVNRAWAYGVDTDNWNTYTTPRSVGAPAATIARVNAPGGIFTQNIASGTTNSPLGATNFTVWVKDTSMAMANYTLLGELDGSGLAVDNPLYDLYGVISVASMPSKAGSSASGGRR